MPELSVKLQPQIPGKIECRIHRSKGSKRNPKIIEKIPNKSKHNLKDSFKESTGPNFERIP
jgi:hypothetical protein